MKSISDLLRESFAPDITHCVIHCAATANGKPLSNAQQTAAECIDTWHRKRGFCRSSVARAQFNPHLGFIGYHFVVDVDGAISTGRKVGEIGAHVKGHNKGSIGICMVGTDQFTEAQWHSLMRIVDKAQKIYPGIIVCGHRDLSPDINGDGRVTPDEYTKLCPGFTVADWLANGCQALPNHICLP